MNRLPTGRANEFLNIYRNSSFCTINMIVVEKYNGCSLEFLVYIHLQQILNKQTSMNVQITSKFNNNETYCNNISS